MTTLSLGNKSVRLDMSANQPRDKNGKWTDGGVSGLPPRLAKKAQQVPVFHSQGAPSGELHSLYQWADGKNLAQLQDKLASHNVELGRPGAVKRPDFHTLLSERNALQGIVAAVGKATMEHRKKYGDG